MYLVDNGGDTTTYNEDLDGDENFLGKPVNVPDDIRAYIKERKLRDSTLAEAMMGCGNEFHDWYYGEYGFGDFKHKEDFAKLWLSL